MRQRERNDELGPEFRFNSTLQVQRIMDTLQHDTGRYYQIEDIKGSARGYSNDKAIKKFCKTGEHDFVPGLDVAQYDSDTDLNEALKRDKKIHQTTFVIPPRRIMPELHRRLHYKGG